MATTDSINPTSVDLDNNNLTDDVTFFNNEIGTSDTGQELVTVDPTDGSTIMPSLNTFINYAIITVAGGVGILLLLLNILVIISIFVYWRAQRTKDKRKVNPRLSLTSMIYNTVYNGNSSNTLETTNSHKVETTPPTEHIYEAIPGS